MYRGKSREASALQPKAGAKPLLAVYPKPMVWVIPSFSRKSNNFVAEFSTLNGIVRRAAALFHKSKYPLFGIFAADCIFILKQASIACKLVPDTMAHGRHSLHRGTCIQCTSGSRMRFIVFFSPPGFRASGCS